MPWQNPYRHEEVIPICIIKYGPQLQRVGRAVIIGSFGRQKFRRETFVEGTFHHNVSLLLNVTTNDLCIQSN
jgi:hypothetical protein